jgi:anion-transporting  ArsA/GET3 family ATPase
VIVTTPEEMPVSESIELATKVREQTTVDLASVIVNRLLPERFGVREQAVFDALSSSKGMAALSKELGIDAEPIVAAATLATSLRRSRTTHLDTLRSGLEPGTPLVLVPELFQRTDGVRATRQVATHLAEELA